MGGINLNRGNLGRKKEDIVANIINAKVTKDIKTKDIDHPASMIKKLTVVTKQTTMKVTKQKAELAISLLETTDQNKPLNSSYKIYILGALKKIT